MLKAAFVLDNISTHGQKHAVCSQVWYNILHDQRKVRIRSLICQEQKMLMTAF